MEIVILALELPKIVFLSFRLSPLGRLLDRFTTELFFIFANPFCFRPSHAMGLNYRYNYFLIFVFRPSIKKRNHNIIPVAAVAGGGFFSLVRVHLRMCDKKASYCVLNVTQRIYLKYKLLYS